MRLRTAGFAALLALAAAPAAAQDSAKIGFVATFSGPAAAIGTDMRDAFELALDQLAARSAACPRKSSTRTTSRSRRSASRRPTS
jgi:ABC-type branched-subunit amino acid transport system substrate-binding protein